MQEFLDSQQIIIYILVLGWLIALSYFFWQIYSHYRRLIGKTKNGDLKVILDKQMESLDEINKSLSGINKRLEQLELDSPNNVKKVGLVRFNPFRQLGGNQSFSLALLDQDSNGVVLSALHSKDSTRVYAKPVVMGKEVKYSFSEEEAEAVKIAKVLKPSK